MKRPKISVIVPVYNVAEYLPKLVMSVCQQTMPDFELLLVNNNSCDGVEAYLDEIVHTDSRIRVLQQPKQGVSATRNKGLEEAKGQYVFFLDGDDVVDAEMFASMLVPLEREEAVDLVMCGYVTEYQGKVIQKITTVLPERMTRENFLCHLYEDDMKDYQGVIWDKLFRRDIIERYHLRFREDVAFNEDRLFVTSYMMYANTVAVLTDCFYHYHVRDDSAMGLGRKYFASEAEMTEMIAFDEILRLLKDYPKAQRLAEKNMAIAQIRLFKRMLDKHAFLQYRKCFLRKYARNFRKLKYEPRDYNEKVLCSKYVFYGYTGISFGVVDTRGMLFVDKKGRFIYKYVL